MKLSVLFLSILRDSDVNWHTNYRTSSGLTDDQGLIREVNKIIWGRLLPGLNV
jgi:hypothetical protein